jgi:hypothetical protein
LERVRITPFELEFKTTVSESTVSALRSGGIDTGLTLLAKADCKQHDTQHVSPLFPTGFPVLRPVFASTLTVASFEAR